MTHFKHFQSWWRFCRQEEKTCYENQHITVLGGSWNIWRTSRSGS
jgi:hypothetical protein